MKESFIYIFWYGPKHKISTFWHNRILGLPFRIKNGFWKCECWNIDYEVARWLIPRLKYFRNNLHSVPMDPDKDFEGMDTKKWQGLLDQMILAFESAERDYFPENFENMKYDDYKELYADEIKKAQEGIDLFAKHFMSLWD